MVETNLKNLFSLENKVILMTGAAGGIGAELAKGMAGVGAIMCACDISEKGLAVLKEQIEAAGGQCETFVMNVTSQESIQAAVDAIGAKFGRIDVLVNVAGINKREGIMDVLEATYDRIMDINLKSVFMVSRIVAPLMMKQHKGSIINIGSHNATAMLGGCSVYGATKSGVLGLTRAMAVEYRSVKSGSVSKRPTISAMAWLFCGYSNLSLRPNTSSPALL